jgi:hypothetical protein
VPSLGLDNRKYFGGLFSVSRSRRPGYGFENGFGDETNIHTRNWLGLVYLGAGGLDC